MRKRIFAGLCALLLAVSMTACGASSSTGDSGEKTESTENALADGTYTADFTTDSDMFHANKARKGKGLLTVKDGKMTFHVSLVSEKIVNLFVGTAEDAAKDGAELLQPTTDTVYYDDGTSEEVYGYDIPVAEVGKGIRPCNLRYQGQVVRPQGQGGKPRGRGFRARNDSFSRCFS